MFPNLIFRRFQFKKFLNKSQSNFGIFGESGIALICPQDFKFPETFYTLDLSDMMNLSL